MANKRRRRKKNFKKPLLLFAVLFLVVLSLVLIFGKPVPVLSPSLEFPVGENLTLSDVVVKVKGGSLSEPNQKLDSSKEGSLSVTYTVKNLLGFESVENFMITFYSENSSQNEVENRVPATTARTAPKISGPDALSVHQGGKIDLSAFTCTDQEGKALEITLSGDYDLNKAGTYSVTLSATDEKGLKAEKSVSLIVIATPTSGGNENGDSKMKDGSYPTTNGKTVVIKNGLATVDGILIANKTYSLPRYYTSSYLQPEAEQAYYKMRTEAKKAGHNLNIKSAYRSWADQNYIFNGYVKNHGLEQALTFSARPGHSEHQTGLAMDLITSSSQDSKLPEIKVILDWLDENAYKYGFVLRYPENKSHITGYIFEPWHYRYVGEDLAATLYNGGDWITLEEHFGIDSVYRGY